MQHKLTIGFLCSLILVALFAGCDGSSTAPETFASLGEEIEYLGRSNVRVGMVVGTITGGERRVYSFGSRSLADLTPPDEDTIFEIGSITKTFTCVLLADMVLRNVIDLDDVVNDYLPSGQVVVPAYNSIDITFEHLATHTSGIPGSVLFAKPPGFDWDDPYALFTTEHMYEYLNYDYSSSREPGAAYEYTNIGMGLLGHLLGLIDGTSYSELLQRIVLGELSMDNTTLFLTGPQSENLAAGHLAHWFFEEETPNWNANDCFQGAGFIKSSMADMLTYLELAMGLTTSPLEDAATLATTPRRDIPQGQIGLGWHILYLPDGQLVTLHDGGTGGYTSFLCFNPEEETGVVVLSNTDDYQPVLDVALGVMSAFGKY